MSHVDEGLLHAWIDGALQEDHSTRHAIELHLAGCADCRSRLDEARQLRDEVVEILAATTPPGIEKAPPFEEIVARAAWLEKTTAPRQRPRRSFLPLAWAATLVLALGAGWWAHHLTRADVPGHDGLETGAPLRTAEDRAPDPSTPGDTAFTRTDLATESVTDRHTGPVTPAESLLPKAPNRSPEPSMAATAPLAEAGEVVPWIQFAALRPELSTIRRHAPTPRPVELPSPADGWVRVDHAAAEAWAGAPLAFAPEFPVVEFAIARFVGMHAVRITQELPDGNLVELIQLTGQSEDQGGEGPGIGRRILSIITWLPNLLGGDDGPMRGDGVPGAIAAAGLPETGGVGVRPVVTPGRTESAAEQIALLPRRMAPEVDTYAPLAPHKPTADPLAGADSVELRRDGHRITVRAFIPPDSLQNFIRRIR